MFGLLRFHFRYPPLLILYSHSLGDPVIYTGGFRFLWPLKMHLHPLWNLRLIFLVCFLGISTWVYPLGASGDVSPNIPDSPTSALTKLLHPNRNALRFSSFSVSRFSTVHLFDQNRNQRLSLPALPLTSSCSTVWSVSLLCVWNAFLL